jgi:hypothetical protein
VTGLPVASREVALPVANRFVEEAVVVFEARPVEVVVVCLANPALPFDDPLLNQRLLSQPTRPTPARNTPARPSTDLVRINMIFPPKSVFHGAAAGTALAVPPARSRPLALEMLEPSIKRRDSSERGRRNQEQFFLPIRERLRRRFDSEKPPTYACLACSRSRQAGRPRGLLNQGRMKWMKSRT